MKSFLPADGSFEIIIHMDMVDANMMIPLLSAWLKEECRRFDVNLFAESRHQHIEVVMDVQWAPHGILNSMLSVARMLKAFLPAKIDTVDNNTKKIMDALNALRDMGDRIAEYEAGHNTVIIHWSHSVLKKFFEGIDEDCFCRIDI